eukprot:m.69126 g.69126  ORF g.69126 m.69126 type:complete len:737 (-) comp13958_c0_seq1:266-2476(-)
MMRRVCIASVLLAAVVLPVAAGDGAGCIGDSWAFYVFSAAAAYVVYATLAPGRRTSYTPNTDDEICQYKKGEKVWTTDPSDTVPIRKAKSGVAAKEPRTVVSQFRNAVSKHPDAVALKVERPLGTWKQWTYSEYYQQARTAAKAFMTLGLEPSQSINIIGFNSPEWLIADVGAILAGGLAAGVYTTNEPAQCQYQADHSKAVVVVCENQKQLEKYLKIRDQLPLLKALVVYNDAVPAGVSTSTKPVYSWDEFMALGASVSDADLDVRMDAQQPGNACTLIYTSGTTGTPKAVMASHDSVTWVGAALLANTDASINFGSQHEHVVSYLPLSHIAAQVLDIHIPLLLTADRQPVTVWFARPDALKGSLPQTLQAARPTFFFGVPRVWEKIQEKMVAAGKESKGLKKSIAAWARGIGATWHQQAQVGGSGKKPWGFALANALVFTKVRQRLGLDRCRALVSGAAPITNETVNFFGSLDLHILEVYGMSENAGPETFCLPDYFKVGTAGTVLRGCEIKIDHDAGRDKPGEGEICFRGRHIMMGYMYNEKKTQEAVDPDGWLHSGDIGRIDDATGLLSITGRIKELIITAGGENIAPVPCENAIKSEAPEVSNLVMIGDKRKFCSCLVTLHTVQNEDGTYSNKLASGGIVAGSTAKTVDEARKDKVYLQHIQDAIDKYNKACVSNASRVQYFKILDKDFVNVGDHAELTSTLKLKRSVVHEKFHAEIDSMYSGKYSSMNQA